MSRCILCFKNEEVCPKLRTDSLVGIKMVSYLILAFGLLCIGAAAGSWNFAEDYNKRKSSEQQWKGFNPVTNLCNECLRTVTDMTKMANGKIEMSTCDDFKAKKNEICKKMVIFMRDNGQFNLLDSRGLCAKAKYCTVKNRNKAKSRPLFVSSSNNRDWSGELGKRRCRGGRNDDNLQSMENPLDLAPRDPKCRECLAIVKEIRKYMDGSEARPFYLPLVCSDIQDNLSDHCFDLIGQRDKDLIQSLNDKKTNYQVCTAVDECPKRKGKIMCSACKNYVHTVKALGFDDDIMTTWACKNSTADEKQHCIQTINNNRARILDIYHQNEDATPKGVCVKAQMCSLLLVSPKDD